MDRLQQFIHKLEVGGGMRYFRWALAALAIFLAIVGYNARAFKNMNTQEAMDSAQLARNIAQGKGYTTSFVRPFSMFLMKRHSLAKFGPAERDPSRIKQNHPDLANAPIYPVVLAGLMKVIKLDYSVSSTKPFWSNNGQFFRYEPDFLISAFNQVLLLLVVVLVYFLARKIFDPSVAWLAALLILGTELLWRFAVSGLSTTLLMLIVVGLAWLLVLLEQEAREPRGGTFRILFLALATGLLAGIGGLTRYSFACIFIPVLAFVVLFSGQRRFLLSLVALLGFAGVMSPWVVRNYSVSGTPFGTAGYSLLETTGGVEHRLERSLEPELGQIDYKRAFWYKLTGNAKALLLSDLPKLSGNWLAAFFLAGLLVGFRNPAATRLRYFLVACLVFLALAQSLCRTQLSEDSPEVNSENLLVLVAPLIVMYGTSLFLALLEQIELPFRELRYAVIGTFGVIVCVPLLLIFLPPRGMPINYPPYYPPYIQMAAGWTKEDELIMSDIPAAVAWYGQRQCVWLTLNAQTDFSAISDYQKPVQALFISPKTLRTPFSDWLRSGGEQSWAGLVMGSVMRVSQHLPPAPPGFPLHYLQVGWPEQFLMTAQEHWPGSQ